jgi:hypothetical protein
MLHADPQRRPTAGEVSAALKQLTGGRRDDSGKGGGRLATVLCVLLPVIILVLSVVPRSLLTVKSFMVSVDKNGKGNWQDLSDHGVVPLTSRDRVKLVIKLNRAAYAYVIWIDSRGNVKPLYPWQEFKDWDQKRPDEEPADTLELPLGGDIPFFRIQGGKGIESILVCVRDTPLDKPERILRSLEGYGEADWREIGLHCAAWRNGKSLRPPTMSPKDPGGSVRKWQEKIYQRVQAEFPEVAVRTVTFASAGEE